MNCNHPTVRVIDNQIICIVCGSLFHNNDWQEGNYLYEPYQEPSIPYNPPNYEGIFIYKACQFRHQYIFPCDDPMDRALYETLMALGYPHFDEEHILKMFKEVKELYECFKKGNYNRKIFGSYGTFGTIISNYIINRTFNEVTKND